MKIEMFSLGNGDKCSVELDISQFEWGAEGRVYRATKDGSVDDYCVKAFYNKTPSAAGTVVRGLRIIARHIDNRIDDPHLPPTPLRTLRALRSYLPTHTAMVRLDEEALSLLILRRYAAGRPLKEWTGATGNVIDLERRYEVARRVMGQLTALSLSGFVHLDPLPDNIFVDFTSESQKINNVALIDLEGVGIHKRTPDSTTYSERLVHSPTTLGKPGTWLVPPWYPKSLQSSEIDLHPFASNLVSAAHWQAICITFFAASGGYYPFNWLTRRAQVSLARLSRDHCSDQKRIALNFAEIDDDFQREILANLGGNSRLFEEFKRRMESGFLRAQYIRSLQAIQDSIGIAMRRS